MSKGHRRHQEEPVPPPSPLARAPAVDMVAEIDELDSGVWQTLQAVAEGLFAAREASNSIDQKNVLLTKANMLLAMAGTHRSIRRLLAGGDQDMDLAVDCFPLTRVQLERCFLALLLEDNPGRWNKRYQKNAWKTFAKKYFRDQCTVGHIEPFNEYFGPNGGGITMLRAFAREMYVWEDELQTLRIQIVGDEPDPRWSMRYIADMPTPAKAIGVLEDPKHKALATLVYPYYDTLSHFTHGGMAGVMEAALLRRKEGDAPDSAQTRGKFWQGFIIEPTLPVSYVSQLLVATVFAVSLDDAALRRQLIDTWRPYHSNGSPLGVAVWDSWAAEALQANGQSGQPGES